MVSDEEQIDSRYWLPHNHPVVTPERFAKRDMVAVETDRGGREIRTIAWPPDYYVAHRHISAEQYVAARRYYNLWAGSKHQHHHVQVAYEERHGTTPVYALGAKVENRFLINLEYVAASKAVRGMINRKVLESVICYDRFAGPQLDRFRESLDQLVSHFKDKRNSLREE